MKKYTCTNKQESNNDIPYHLSFTEITDSIDKEYLSISTKDKKYFDSFSIGQVYSLAKV